MSIQAVPNQPLDWQLLPLAESDCPDCPPADYCSPMYFEKYTKGQEEFYRSDKFSFQISGEITDETSCPKNTFEMSEIEATNDNTSTTLSDDTVNIVFGPTSINDLQAISTLNNFPSGGCSFILDYCFQIDYCQYLWCYQNSDYPLKVIVNVSGVKTGSYNRTIYITLDDIINGFPLGIPDPKEASTICGKLVLSTHPDDLTTTLTIDGSELAPPIVIDKELCPTEGEGEGTPCTAEMTFGAYTICTYGVIGVDLIGSDTEYDGLIDVNYYSASSNGDNFIISGEASLYEIPTNSPFIKECFTISLGPTDECCSICEAQFISTCIKPITDPCGTVKVTYYQDVTTTSDSLGFGFIYPAATPPSSTFNQHMRFRANVRDAKYDGAMVSYQDSLGRKRVVYAERRKSLSLNTDLVPEFVHDALSLACRHDNFFLEDELFGVNDNFFTRSTDYSPTYVRMSRLAPVKLEVEAKTQNLKKNMCI